jgi:hypothetical protein
MKIVYDIEIIFQGEFDFLEKIEGAKIIRNGSNPTNLIVTGTDWKTFCQVWKEMQQSDCEVIYMTQKRHFLNNLATA